MTNGEIPLYDRIYLGYSERIRGHFFDVIEGENRTIGSLAFRFPILPVRYFSISEMPQLSNLQFGISGGLFIDTGSIWFQNENPLNKKWVSGYGLGLHFHVPYVNVLRFELAFDEKGHHQWILDLFVDI
jgi:outer membrane protein assembly factor BamA